MINHIDPDSHPAAENPPQVSSPQRPESKPRLPANLHFNDIEPWPEPIDGELLLNDLRQALLRFVVLPKWAPETLALWILHTYALWRYIPKSEVDALKAEVLATRPTGPVPAPASP